MAAVETLRAIQAEQRPATAGEQQVLARWSGWGAVPRLFDPNDSEFAQQRDRLRTLLSDRQFAHARRSVLNAHYTDANLVGPLWQAVTGMGVTAGRVLEPGCGSGNVIGLAPEGMALTGVELDPTTAGIAAALYPQAEILTGSFADTTGGEDAFDAVVGNVPFGRTRLHDPEHNPHRHPIHTHFILKSLRMAAPGAPVALVTSRYVLDAVDDTARAQIAELADLVSAVRLPSAAHQQAAGTNVVTDVLLLRRRAEDQQPQHVGPWQQSSLVSVPDRADGTAQLRVNELFQQQPQRVLGTLASDSGRFGQPDLIVPNGPSDLGSSLAAALTTDVDRAREQGLTSTPASTVPDQQPIQLRTAARDDGRFEGVISENSDGSFARWSQGSWHEHAVPKTQADELSHLVGLRDTAQALLVAEHSSSEDTDEITELRAELNTRYDTYRQHYPPVNRFSWKTRTLPGWTVFGRWCEQQQRTKMPASSETILDYLRHLSDEGLDQDRLRTHLQAITDRHARKDVPLATETHDVAEAIVLSCPTEAASSLDPVALGLVTEARQSPPQGGFRTDPLSSLVRALEDFDPVSQTADKADIFHQRVVAPRQSRTRAESPADALSICLNNHAQVHLDVIAELLELDGPEAAQQVLTTGQHPLAFTDPDTGEVQARNDYLSGNVRAKLTAAEAAAEGNAAFDGHVTALRAVVPATRGPEEIEIQLGSWIEAPYVQQFLREILNDPHVRVDHPGARLWVVADGDQRSTATRETWGTEHRSAQQLTESLLNGRPIRITYTDREGNLLTDAPATEQAQAQAAAISDRFSDWVWDDPTRADELVTLYNDRFNAHIPRVYDDVELTLPGLSDAAPTLRPHQQAAVAAQIFNPSFGLYHEVGAGKTLEMIIGAMERKRLGLTARQVFNIPNHMLEQFEREWLRAYPQANLLTASREELSGNRRRDFVARAATGDYDAVILTEGAFRALAVSPEVEERFLAAERDEIEQALDAARTGECAPRTIKELEEQLARAEEAVKGKLAKIDRDPGLCWDDFDFDTVIVDESQRFKNARRFSSLPSMGHPGSDRATDLDMKLDDLVFKHGHARYVSATATPFTNSLAEIYTELGRLGAELPDLDSWARTWGKMTTSQEMVPGGSYKEITRLRELLNAPELALQLRQHADIRTAEDLNLPTPSIAGDGPQILTVDAPTELGEFNAELADRYQKLKPRPDVGDDNHLSLINEAISSALDMRLVGRGSTEPQKVDVLVDRIWQRWLDHRDDVYLRPDGTEHPTRGSLQLVFCSLSTPKRDQWNVYDEIRDQLADRGMPRELVRFIHEASNDQQKAELFAAARSGDIAVLIGSAEKMGTGTNVQARAIGLYQLSPPWRADIPRQEIGRVVRPGNRNSEVFVEQLVTAPSLETKKWKIVRDKDHGFRPLMTGQISSRHLEMPDEDSDHFAELMAAASGDPRILEKADLESHVNRLLRLQQAWARQQSSHRLTLSRVENEVPQLEHDQDQLDTALTRRRDTSGEQFAMTLAGQHYTSRSKAAAQLAQRVLDAVDGAPKDATPEITLGQLGGFTVTAEIRRWHLNHSLAFHLDGVPGALTLHHTEVSPNNHGLITRLENWIGKLDEQRDRITTRITRINEDAEQARELLGTPFARQAELDDTQQRLTDLISQLSANDEHEQTTTEQDPAAEQPAAAASEPAVAARSTSSASSGPTSDSRPGEVIGTAIDGAGNTRRFEVPGVSSSPDAAPESTSGATGRAGRDSAAAGDSEQQDTSHASAPETVPAAAASETRAPEDMLRPEPNPSAVPVRTDTVPMLGHALRLREHAEQVEAIAEHAAEHRDDTIRVGGQGGDTLPPETDLSPYTSTETQLGTTLVWRGLHLQVTWSGRYAALVGCPGQDSSVLTHIGDRDARLSSLTAGVLHEGLSHWLADLPSEASWARAEAETLLPRRSGSSPERQPQQAEPPEERNETSPAAAAPGAQTGAPADPNAAQPDPAPPEPTPATPPSSAETSAERLVPAHWVPLPSVRRGQHTLHLSRAHGLVLLGIREGADHPRSMLKDQKADDLKVGRWEKVDTGIWRGLETHGQPHTAELLQRARNVWVRLWATQRIEARMDLHLDVPRDRAAQQVLDESTVTSQLYGLTTRNALATATIHDVPLTPENQRDEPTAAAAPPDQPAESTREPDAPSDTPALDLGLTGSADTGRTAGEQTSTPALDDASASASPEAAPSTPAGSADDDQQPSDVTGELDEPSRQAGPLENLRDDRPVDPADARAWDYLHNEASTAGWDVVWHSHDDLDPIDHEQSRLLVPDTGWPEQSVVRLHLAVLAVTSGRRAQDVTWREAVDATTALTQRLAEPSDETVPPTDPAPATRTSIVVHASSHHGLQLHNGTISTLTTATEHARDRQVPIESWRVALTGPDRGTWHVPGTAGKAITADQLDHLAALTRFLRSERGLAVELDVHREDLADDAETHARWRQHAELLAPNDTTGTEPDIADTEQPEDRAPTATQDTAEFAEPAETADGEQDELRQVVSELLGRHHLKHVEGVQQALIRHVRAELADPWLSQLALVNDRDNYAMQVSTRLADRFVEATIHRPYSEPDELMRPLTAGDSPLRAELSDWFADYSYTLLNATDTNSATESATADQRVLRLHYSDEHGLLLLGSQRTDGLGPALRAKRSAWKHRNSIVGPDPSNTDGAWFLQNTRQRTFYGSNAQQRRTQFRHRLETEVIDALDHLSGAGHQVRLDLHDLPVAVINRLRRHHARVIPEDTRDVPSDESGPDVSDDAPAPDAPELDADPEPAEVAVSAPDLARFTVRERAHAAALFALTDAELTARWHQLRVIANTNGFHLAPEALGISGAEREREDVLRTVPEVGDAEVCVAKRLTGTSADADQPDAVPDAIDMGRLPPVTAHSDPPDIPDPRDPAAAAWLLARLGHWFHPIADVASVQPRHLHMTGYDVQLQHDELITHAAFTLPRNRDDTTPGHTVGGEITVAALELVWSQRDNLPTISVPAEKDADQRARATESAEAEALFDTEDIPDPGSAPAEEHTSLGTASSLSATAADTDAQHSVEPDQDSTAAPVDVASREDDELGELAAAHQLTSTGEQPGLVRVHEPDLPDAVVATGSAETGWANPDGDPVELGAWLAAYRHRAPRPGVAAAAALAPELAIRICHTATQVVAPETDTARTNLSLAVGLARAGQEHPAIEQWVSAAEHALPNHPQPPGDMAATATPETTTAVAAPEPVQLPTEQSRVEVEPATAATVVDQAPAGERERIAWLNAHAAAWFDQQLDQSAQAQTYLRDRLGSDEAVAVVRARLTVGWAPHSWTEVTRHLQQLQGPDGARAVSDDDLITAGLAKRSRTGGIIDVFRGRLVFGFVDQQGQLAGFTGRIHPAFDDRAPKYLNTPATPLFTKGTLLLGVHEQREQIADGADVVLCEGPLDAAAILATADAAGDDTLVPLAASGTAITNQHLDQLHSLAQARVIHALDADAATNHSGLDLLHRSLTRLPHEQHVTQLPHGDPPAGTDPDQWSGHDPATWSLAHGRESLNTYRPSSDYCQPALTPLVNERLSHHRLDETDGQVNAVHSAAALLAELDPTGPHAASVLDEAARVAPLLYEPGDMAGLLVHYRSLPAGTSPAEARASANQYHGTLEIDPDEPTDPEEVELAPDDPLPPAESDTSVPVDAPSTDPPDAFSDLPQPAVEPDSAPVLAAATSPVASQAQEPAAPADPDPAPAPQHPVVVHHSHDYGSLLWGPDQAWLADALTTARLQGTRVGAWTYDPDAARPDGASGAWRIRGTAGHLAPSEAVTLLQQATAAITAAGVPAELDLAATEATAPARALLTTPDDSHAHARDHASTGAGASAGPRARALTATEQAAITALEPDETRTPDGHTTVALTELAGRWVLHAATTSSANNPLTMTTSFASHDAAHAAADTMTSHTLPDIARRAVTAEQASGTLADQPLPPQLTPAALAAYDRTLAADTPTTSPGGHGQRHEACSRAISGVTAPVGSTGPASTSTTPATAAPPPVEHTHQPRERTR